MHMRLVLFSCLLLMVGCTHTPAMTTPVYTPVSGVTVEPTLSLTEEENMTRSQVFIDSTELLILESYPIQVHLQLAGSLPTPCHKLRSFITPPDKENRIFIEVYSAVDPEVVCVQVLEPFSSTINLGSFPSGHYIVYLNEELIAEFDN